MSNGEKFQLASSAALFRNDGQSDEAVCRFMKGWRQKQKKPRLLQQQRLFFSC